MTAKNKINDQARSLVLTRKSSTKTFHRIVNSALLITVMGFSTLANAALVGRLAATPGGTDYQAYYDDVADLTWLADANAAGTTMNWADANSWQELYSLAGRTFK